MKEIRFLSIFFRIKSFENNKNFITITRSILGSFIDSLRRAAGGIRPTFSQSVYLSEKGCAYNNMALAYFMKVFF